MDHLKLDKEHMEAENKELNNEILHKTEEFQTRKEELLLQRGLLQVKATHLNNYHGNASKLDQFRKHLEARQKSSANTSYFQLSVFGKIVK